jgi:hypothetical protein
MNSTDSSDGQGTGAGATLRRSPRLLSSTQASPYVPPRRSLRINEQNDDNAMRLVSIDGSWGSLIPNAGQDWTKKVGEFGLCICGRGRACKEVTMAWRVLNDARGGMVAWPKSNDHPNSTNRGVLLKSKKSLRWQRYLNVRTTQIDKIKDHRDQSIEGVNQRRTREQQNRKIRKQAFVALHHFHPVLLKDDTVLRPCANGMRKLTDLVSIEKVRSTSIGNSTDYCHADQYNADQFILVPSYHFSTMENDLSMVQQEARVKAASTAVSDPLPPRRGVNNVTPEIPRATSARTTSVNGSGIRATSARTTSVNPSRIRIGRSTGNNNQRQVARRSTTGNTAGSSSREQAPAISFQEIISHLKERMRELEERLVTNDLPNHVDIYSRTGLCGPKSGYNRLSLTSDVWHSYPHNKGIAKKLFGFDDWNHTKFYMKALFQLEHQEPTFEKLNEQLSEFELCLMSLTWMNNKKDRLDVSTMFGTFKNNVTRANSVWVERWGRAGVALSILPFIDAELIDELEPEKYVKLNLRDVGSVLDGKDYLTETARSDRVNNVSQQSNKMSHSAFRNLTWSLPMGMVFEYTAPFLARASEKSLVHLWGANGRLKNIPKGYAILLDKGFDKISGWLPNYNAVYHPAFLTKGKFDDDQIKTNLMMCQNRYSCEVVYARVAQVDNLNGIVKREKFPWFEDIMNWGHGRANLMQPIQMPARHRDYFCSTTVDNDDNTEPSDSSENEED